MFRGNIDNVREHLEKGADPNVDVKDEKDVKCVKGRTPLHHAASAGQVGTIIE